MGRAGQVGQLSHEGRGVGKLAPFIVRPVGPGNPPRPPKGQVRSVVAVKYSFSLPSPIRRVSSWVHLAGIRGTSLPTCPDTNGSVQKPFAAAAPSAASKKLEGMGGTSHGPGPG